ncbi:MAG: hypothetical protein P1U85_13475 [Verrucomicrobiales bacterium]|nr:hypothetical protein [Verrucomicrobiales bacterium]
MNPSVDSVSSSVSEQGNPKSAPAWRRVLFAILRYLGAYLLGILICVLATPVEATLAGKALWPLYPLAAVPCFFLFYFYLDSGHTTGSVVTHWLFGAVGCIPLLAEVIFRWKLDPMGRWARPFWIGVPIGFLGTMGAYYTAAASI